MMRTILCFAYLMLMFRASSQNMDDVQLGELWTKLATANHDTVTILTLTQLAEARRVDHLDSTYLFAQRALQKSREIGYPLGEMRSDAILSYYYFIMGDLTRALDLGLRSLEIARQLRSVHDQALALIRVGNVYMNLTDYREAQRYYEWSKNITLNTTDTFFHVASYKSLAEAYLALNMVDSALFFGRKAEDSARSINNTFLQQEVSPIIGQGYSKKGKDSLALYYLRKPGNIFSELYLAEFFQKRGPIDSAFYYANASYQTSVKYKVKRTEYLSALLLSSLYEKSDISKALYFRKVGMAAMDSMYSAEKIMAAKSVAHQIAERKRELEVAEMNWRNQVRIWLIMAGLGVFVIIALLQFRHIRKEQKSIKALNKQKAELSATLDTLKSTQAQLIQSEKMASLGELTAGIAHEIQNPMNFVTNFSDLNQELIDDLTVELKNGNSSEALDIAAKLKENEAKVNIHGKKADSIVKNMLQHSRTGSFGKELTDVNRMVDEYVRLAYNGYHTKFKDIHIELDFDMDPHVGSVTMVRQDIGRVLLNLLNNAFYAVNERRRNGEDDYRPKVLIRTTLESNAVTITIEDNGVGIPADKMGKIFHPFFTTKPTGEGTGLGLSLSYDIVKKAHGGELYCESAEGQGAKFSIKLPIQH